MKSIEEQLELHEGKKNKPYKDSVGKLTIGIGRNLEDKGLTDDECFYLLRNDIKEVKNQLSRNLSWFSNLDLIRKKVLIDMGFNLGIPGLLRFKKFLSFIKTGNFEKAAEEMLDSKWAEQVGKRAERLSKMMATGKDYDELNL